LLFFHIVGQEWDALHLYIAKNLDWMENWIEDCEEYFSRLLSLMFLKVNVNKSFTQRYQVKKVGDTLLDMIQEED